MNKRSNVHWNQTRGSDDGDVSDVDDVDVDIDDGDVDDDIDVDDNYNHGGTKGTCNRVEWNRRMN